MKKKVAVLCATHRDKRELKFEHICKDREIVFHEFDAELIDRLVSKGFELPQHMQPEHVINEIMSIHSKHNVNGILATDDYPGSLFASYIAQKLNLKASSVQAQLLCQHKYYSRLIQQQIVPEATPAFALVNPELNPKKQVANLSFPFFVKPIKSYFSLFAQRINSFEELAAVLAQPRTFSLHHFNWFLDYCDLKEVPAHFLLAEELLEGTQVTWEGHIFENEVVMHGVVDSIMFPGTICFARFDYPSKLSEDIQQRMTNIASKAIKGLGFNNGIFNIEFMYNPKTNAIQIIEINPRMASQFADIFEKVDGTNTYEVLLDIATGQKPVYNHKKGKYMCASSFVLRTFQDQLILKLPSVKDVEKTYMLFPDVRIEIFGTQGNKLSDELQDGKSFRYGLIHLGADNEQELYEKFQHCNQLLPFSFYPIINY